MRNDIVLQLPLLSNAALANAASLQRAIQTAPADADTAAAMEVLSAGHGLQNLQTGWLSSSGFSRGGGSILTTPIGAYLHPAARRYIGEEGSGKKEFVLLAMPVPAEETGNENEGWDKAKALKVVDDYKQFLQRRVAQWRAHESHPTVILTHHARERFRLEVSLLPLLEVVEKTMASDQILEARIFLEEVILKFGLNHATSDNRETRLALPVVWNHLDFKKLLEITNRLLSLVQQELPESFRIDHLSRPTVDVEEWLRNSEREEKKIQDFSEEGLEIVEQLRVLIVEGKFKEAHALLGHKGGLLPYSKNDTFGESATDGIQEIFLGLLQKLGAQYPEEEDSVAALAKRCWEMAQRDLSPKGVKVCEGLLAMNLVYDRNQALTAQNAVRRMRKRAAEEGADNLCSELDKLLEKLRLIS